MIRTTKSRRRVKAIQNTEWQKLSAQKSGVVSFCVQLCSFLRAPYVTLKTNRTKTLLKNFRKYRTGLFSKFCAWESYLYAIHFQYHILDTCPKNPIRYEHFDKKAKQGTMESQNSILKCNSYKDKPIFLIGKSFGNHIAL